MRSTLVVGAECAGAEAGRQDRSLHGVAREGAAPSGEAGVLHPHIEGAGLPPAASAPASTLPPASTCRKYASRHRCSLGPQLHWPLPIFSSSRVG